MYPDALGTLNGRHPDAKVCVAAAEWVAKTIASKDAVVRTVDIVIGDA